MLPILPKVTKLQQKKIASFGGIDRREGARENTFSKLYGVDNVNGTGLETGNNFLCAKTDFVIESDDVLMVDNEEGGKDTYYLGEGGFYKNGTLLPLSVKSHTADLSWMTTFVPELSVAEDGTCSWAGDYKHTKLIRYDNCIFAVPQMIYTDGESVFFWNNLRAMQISSGNIRTGKGYINITPSSIHWRNTNFGKFIVGDEINIFTSSGKLEGTFTILSNSSEEIKIEAIDPDGEPYESDDLDLPASSGNDYVICIKDLPRFVDADIVYNRMWAVAGNRIYASQLARPFTFSACEGTESDAWWADTEDSEDFVALASLNGRIVAFKRNSAYEVYGTVNPYTIKDVSRSMGCISRASLKEVNGVLFLLTGEGMSVYGGSKFVNINEALCAEETEVHGMGKGSKYYAMMSDGVYKYDYYSGLWTNVTDMKIKGLVDIDFDVFGLTDDGGLIQFTGEKKDFLSYSDSVKREWLIESTSIGSGDFYAEGINKLELRFETEGVGEIAVSVSRDGGEFENCGEVTTGSGWQIFSLPISFVPCSTFKYRIKGTGKLKLRLINYSFRKGGGANKYE